jgi:benzoylformate decarboxylase
VKTAASSPPGPVIVGIPYDIVDEEIDTQVKETHPMIAQVNYKRQCDPSTISLPAEELNRARRIAIVAGYEVDITDAHEELKELSSKLKAPVFAEPHFSRSPSAEFVKVLPRNASGVNSALSEYDVVLPVRGMLHNVLYMDEELRTRDVIQITSDPEEATKRAWRSILCDPKSFLKEILPKVTEREGSNVLDLKVKEGRVGEIMKALSSRLNGYAVFEETPSHKEPVKMILGRRRRLYFSNRSGLLGWAIPASIGYVMAGGNAVTLVGMAVFTSLLKPSGRQQIMI